MFGWLWRKLVGVSRQPEYVWIESSPNDERGISSTEDVFYDAASRFLDVQISTNDVFDSRTANAFSIGSTVLPVTFGLLRLSAATIPMTTIGLLTAALTMYVALAFCVWRASRIRVLAYLSPRS